MTNGLVLDVESPAIEMPAETSTRLLTQEGLQFERDFFGFCTLDQRKDFDPDEDENRLFDNIRKVMNEQTNIPWNAKNPQVGLARKLFRAVKQELPRKARGRLMLCCALGTPLDRMGVDGFFTLEADFGTIFTFDLARRRHKWKYVELKADTLITIQDMSSDKRILNVGSFIGRVITAVINERATKPTNRVRKREGGRWYR